MENLYQFHIKIKSFSRPNYILTIRDKDFQLVKEKSKSNKIKTYSLENAIVIDKSKNADLEFTISSPLYKFNIKPLNKEDKKLMLNKLENIVKTLSTKKALSNEYQQYNKKLEKKNGETNQFNNILLNLNAFKILIGEINRKILKLKKSIQEKLKKENSREFMGIHNDLEIVSTEMKKQFKNLYKNINKYLIVNNDKNIEEESSSSSDDSDENKNIIKIKKKLKKNNPFYFLSSELIDYYDPNFEFSERCKLPKNIKCPQNIIKEMISSMTKNQPMPIYFNEPISMCQKQCEKFYYLDLLNKASLIKKNPSLQMCYIAAFIIGEIFLNIGRFLKPFNPIIGETFEFCYNCQKFRYYSEQVKHHPPITAFIGETPNFVYYGDTANDTSFKFFKGAMELTFKNKINVFLKNSGNHYVFNRPIVSVKGLMKPPMYNDYSGCTIIQDTNNKNLKCELNFIEQSWTSEKIGDIEGKVFSDENKVDYIIGGNWQNEIFITDVDGNNKEILLKLNKQNLYLENNLEKYNLPYYTSNLNYLNDALKNVLPKNDSRFREDIRLLEIGGDNEKAQEFKDKYEEKQRKELNNENHKILFFIEKKDIETDEVYYLPNGEYWELKKEGTLKNNENKDIFDVSKY